MLISLFFVPSKMKYDREWDYPESYGRRNATTPTHRNTRSNHRKDREMKTLTEKIGWLCDNGFPAFAAKTLAKEIEEIKAKLPKPKEKPIEPVCPTCGLTDDEIYSTRSKRLTHEMGCLAMNSVGVGQSFVGTTTPPTYEKGERHEISTERRRGKRRVTPFNIEASLDLNRRHCDDRRESVTDMNVVHKVEAVGSKETSALLAVRVLKLENALAVAVRVMQPLADKGLSAECHYGLMEIRKILEAE